MNFKIILFSFFCVCIFIKNINAQNKPQNITSKIEKVTVFVGGANVIRKAKITIPQGKNEFIFSGISPYIDKQSIQIKGQGNFTILSVIHQNNFINEQKQRTEISALENEKKNIKTKINYENNLLNVFKNEEVILSKNQTISGNTGLKTTDLKEAVDFQRNRLTEVLLKQTEISQNIQKLDSAIIKIDNQLKTLNQSKNLSTSDILVTVSSKEIINTTFELSYYVNNAGWFATYDLRVKDISSPLDLAFKANVFQNSGEDWKDVKLTLSNGNPTESGVAPTLTAWRLGFGYPKNNNTSHYTRGGFMIPSRPPNQIQGRITDERGEGIPGVSISLKGSTTGTVSQADGTYSIIIPNGLDNILVFSSLGMKNQEIIVVGNSLDVALKQDDVVLSEVVVVGYGEKKDRKTKKEKKKQEEDNIPLEVNEVYQPTTFNFEIEMPYTILNDGKFYMVEVKTHSIPTIYEYIAVPKLEKAAYLNAKIIDWQEYNLLDGEVNLFLEGAYLGKSLLDIQNADDTLSISLGKDKNIVVERKKLKEFSSKKFLSSYRKESRAYEISIRNNKPKDIKIIVQDQLPMPVDKEISLEDEEFKEGTIQETNKIITWKFDIAPKQEKKALLKYSVKYPKNKIVVID